jgi:Ca-activated chloride channel family protein
MSYGRSDRVRSHRRGGARRRVRVAPWIRITLATSVLAAGAVTGYAGLIGQACSGRTGVRITAAPATATLLEALGAQWAATEPSFDGRCGTVTVEARDSAQMAAALGAEWDARTGGEPPHVWVPASSAWLQRAAASDVGAALMPGVRPSIARSPAVIAMPRPMAEQLDWPATELEWPSVLDGFAGAGAGWDRLGRPEWGDFRFAMSDPTRSTAALLALSAVVDADMDGEVSRDEAGDVARLARLTRPDPYYETTEQILADLTEAAREDSGQALRVVSAFPALEQDVLLHNRINTEAPLSAVYPVDVSIEADHPYLVLNAPWVGDLHRAAAAAFLDYVRGPQGQAALREAGLRGPNGEAGADFTAQYGLLPGQEAPPRSVLEPTSVTRALHRWTALTRATNLLLVLDVSASMRDPVPGTDDTRQERTASAAAEAVTLFAGDARMGLWEFAGRRDGDRYHRNLVGLGRLAEALPDGRARREHLLRALTELRTSDDTGLYSAIGAAHRNVLDNYAEDATNMVVLVTDGTAAAGGISLDELIASLRDAPGDRPVRVVAVGIGEEVDLTVLEEITRVTGGRAYRSVDGSDLDSVLLSAVFDTAPIS